MVHQEVLKSPHPVDLCRLLPAPLKDAVEVSMWRKCYTMPEVNAALSKIQLVGYSQKIVSTCEAVLRSTVTTSCFPAFLWKCPSFSDFPLGPV